MFFNFGIFLLGSVIDTCYGFRTSLRGSLTLTDVIPSQQPRGVSSSDPVPDLSEFSDPSASGEIAAARSVASEEGSATAPPKPFPYFLSHGKRGEIRQRCKKEHRRLFEDGERASDWYLTCRRWSAAWTGQPVDPNPRCFEDDFAFEEGKEIGSVCIAKKRQSCGYLSDEFVQGQSRFAVKTYERPTECWWDWYAKGSGLQRELDAMKELNGHPRFPQVFAVYECNETVRIVMELCSRGGYLGNLQGHIKTSNGQPQPEPWTRGVMQDVFAGLSCLHELKLSHGQIRPNHVVLYKDGEVTRAKLVGLSSVIKNYDENMDFPAPEGFNRVYWSPQRVANKYSTTADDVWAAGVLLYSLITGVWFHQPGDYRRKVLAPNGVHAHLDQLQPKTGKSLQEIHNQLKFSNCATTPVKGLIKDMLVADEKKRVGIAECEEHVWFRNGETAAELKTTQGEGEGDDLSEEPFTQFCPRSCPTELLSRNHALRNKHKERGLFSELMREHNIVE